MHLKLLYDVWDLTVVTASSGIGLLLSLILNGAEAITFSTPDSKCPLKAPLGWSGERVGSRNCPVVSTTSLTP